jgi:phosphoribosylformylglycinamidine synthase
MSASSLHFLLPGLALPSFWPRELKARAFYAVAIFDPPSGLEVKIRELFAEAQELKSLSQSAPWVVRAFKRGVSHPMAASLGAVLGLADRKIRVDQIIVSEKPAPGEVLKTLKWTWREPAIEELYTSDLARWRERNEREPPLFERRDDSFDQKDPLELGLEFSAAELRAIELESRARGRAFNRAELELLAQTWSEHCKHKIFAATIRSRDTLASETRSLFKTHIREPTFEIMEREKGKNERCLSVFHDNAGVLALRNERGEPTDWAICLKMETHNSPSAISPYGGASTGVVGVHRDILGTGLGAMPIANWDVLCFESPLSQSNSRSNSRPESALPPDVIRLGVIKGIEDGGNQSGIPTVQGSVVFDPRYAVKPLVYAGAVGLLPKKDVNKRPASGLKLYCFGGATGADGLRGAVMSSRDLRSDDFSGAAVQVANAFVQRRMTDFLIEARDLGLIDSVTDNGAGGLASSVGEMAQATPAERRPGGAKIDLTRLRLKFEGLHGWERLVSESQERMTVATAEPERLEALAREWDVPYDRLGELNDSGRFVVEYEGASLVDLRLEFLHNGCPLMELETRWTRDEETRFLARELEEKNIATPRVSDDFARMLGSIHLCSRENLVRRFDHEVQGRTLRKPFAGATQHSPQDATALEIYECEARRDASSIVSSIASSMVLAHGLAPQRSDIVENTLFSFDEAVRQALLAGARFESAGLLDNFCWPDPIPSTLNPRGERHLWRLVRCCETLSELCRIFELPLVSGKDSMKNNSKDFEVPATLVISLGASSIENHKRPVGFFARANDVVFRLPLLGATLKDSAWERSLGFVASEMRNETVPRGRSEVERHEHLTALARELKSRYARMSRLIESGKIRSAKDISEGGLLTAAFEMALGRELGLLFEDAAPKGFDCFSEGLGGFLLGVDPHHARAVQDLLPEARRVGVVAHQPLLRWREGFEFELSSLSEVYLAKGREGFWGP